MQRNVVNWIVLLVGLILTAGFLFSLVKDGIFFLTRQDVTGKVISIEDSQTKGKSVVKVQFYTINNEAVTSVIRLSRNSSIELRESNTSEVKVQYSTIMPVIAYLSDYNTPRIGILLFDTIIFLLGVIAIKASYKMIFVRREFDKT
jgi:hypothetical protein